MSNDAEFAAPPPSPVVASVGGALAASGTTTDPAGYPPRRVEGSFTRPSPTWRRAPRESTTMTSHPLPSSIKPAPDTAAARRQWVDSPPSYGNYERAMLEFARGWHRFGGGSAQDIFVEFGLNEQEFFSRVLSLVGAPAPSGPGIPSTTDIQIRKVCRWRLYLLAERRAMPSTDARRAR